MDFKSALRPMSELCPRGNGFSATHLFGLGGTASLEPVEPEARPLRAKPYRYCMSTCKQCGLEVKWVKNGERFNCLNADGSDHWDLCSLTRWLQVKATGQRFENQRESGYANSIHGTKLDRLSAKPIPGEHYKPSGDCKNCVPPWELCPDCPDGLQGRTSIELSKNIENGGST